ncbi:MAG TPA: TolC family protein [Terracidiphilus sp.]|nr:TolC family protein [Terracidiphilus sp.]
MMKSRKCIAALVILAGSLGEFAFGQVSTGRQAPAGQQTPYRLTLADAIQKGLQANLNVLLSGARLEGAEGTRERRLAAALLPRVNAQTYANIQNRDLRAFGISLPGMPEVVGPFSNYDVRVYAQQNIVDRQSLHGLRASERALDADKLDDLDARDLIVRAVGALYLNAESAEARAKTAQSRVNDSDALYKLARDKHDAGTATGVDVLRANVQLANDRQALLVAQNNDQLAILSLARNLGMTPGTPLELAEALEYKPLTAQSAEELVPDALAARADYQSLAAQRQALVEQQRANHARAYPKLSINGNFGGIGRSIGGMQPTGMLQGQIDFTIFDRDRAGEAQELAAQIKSIDDRIADMRRGIDQDVREALLNLESAAQQVEVAQQGQALAQRELEMAQDRFQQGAANNVEVVTAQAELARAEENTILAVSSHVDAKFALARALGNTQKKIAEFDDAR